MDSSKIGVRYARALFGVAQERKITEEIRQDLDLILRVFNENPDLPGALDNPVIQPSRKFAFLNAVFKGQIQELTLEFIRMVVLNRRESSLKDIFRHFMYLYRTSNGLKPAHLVTARHISDATRTEMIALIRNYFKTEVELTQEINESIIGGFVLTVDDQQLDASVTSGLQQIKRELSKRIR